VRAFTRRQFAQGMGTTGLALLAACGRWPGQAPAPARIARIGVLSPSPASRPEANPNYAAFLTGLREHGWVDGQNIAIAWRHAENRPDHLPELAAELVHLPVDVMVAGGLAVYAAKDATTTIPIVMPFHLDPVGTGVVASLARPGGNITGLSEQSSPLAGKRLQLVREVVPGLSRVGVLWSVDSPGVREQLEAVQAAAPVLGVTVDLLEVRDTHDVERALDAAASEPDTALLVLSVPLFGLQASGRQLLELAARHRLPTMYSRREFVDAAALMAYGPSQGGLWRRAAYYVDRILRGTKPVDLPVEQPTVFEFVINLRTAQMLGLAIPHHVLLQATEVIQ
jgi:putative tryptophan/tyrosine transport system substrate-binding protein